MVTGRTRIYLDRVVCGGPSRRSVPVGLGRTKRVLASMSFRFACIIHYKITTLKVSSKKLMSATHFPLKQASKQPFPTPLATGVYSASIRQCSL